MEEDEHNKNWKNSIKFFQEIASNAKKGVVKRLFWGRSSVYRSIIHSFVFILSFVLIISGFSINVSQLSDTQNFLSGPNLFNNNSDLLSQGSSIETVLEPTTTANFQVTQYIIQENDTVESIAEAFNVSTQSIKLSNTDVIDYYQDTFGVGETLQIPDFNGVLITAGTGENLASIKESILSGDERDIIEVNNLKPPNYEIEEGRLVLIPDGLIEPPPDPRLGPSFIPRGPSSNSTILAQDVDVSSLVGRAFVDSLSHPDCSGYTYSRGFTSWHTGVDLAKFGGCPIRAVESGTVYFAGWSSSGEGYYVGIDHGDGIRSMYFHGDGNIWVQAGDIVQKGQEVMYMGCTGWCTGTHVHFAMKVNGIFIDPAPYVPYARPF